MRAAVLSALLVPVFLTGCSTYVTVVSEPEGAVITDASGSIVYGRAPLDVEYDTNELRHGAHPGQCAQIPGFTARWPSGASASTDAALPLCDLRHGMTVRINRPKSAPGLEQDLQWALERAQKRARPEACARRRNRTRPHDALHGPRLVLGTGLGPLAAHGAPAAEAREIISLLRNTIGTHHAQRQKGGHLRP